MIQEDPTRPAVLLPKAAVMARTGVKNSRLYDLISKSQFPAPVKVGRSSLWLDSEVNSWIGRQVAKRDRSITATQGTSGEAA